MPDIYLHHYPISPFAEKIRLILGYKKLAWKSVTIPSIMPKPDVVALTGGYRKTPILQVGSHIYCDTALIADVLEHLQPTPTLYPQSHKGVARVLAQWADDKLFSAAMGWNFQPKGAAQVFDKVAPPDQVTSFAKAFAKDRADMRAGAPRLPAGDAGAALKSYLRRLANMLDGQKFLLGDAPCIADFAAYPPLWFTRTVTPAVADVLNATPAVLAWLDRMAAIGHAQSIPADAAQAIADCAQAPESASLLPETTWQDEHGIPLGSLVTIAADGFGPEPTTGTLVAATRMHYTLKRVDPRAGTVHVHFPRIGFILKKASA
jgi:glutathione S-transferase